MKNSLTYMLCKNKIERGMYESQEKMQEMLDVFYAGERISTEEYTELSNLLKSRHD